MNPIMTSALMEQAVILIVWGIMAHFVADWLLQNDWMVLNKANLRHPAGWVHAAIHTVCALLVFTWPAALFIGLTHVYIDTRIPLRWWMARIKQVDKGPHVIHVELWLDQVFHILVLAIVSVVVVSLSQ